jgi:hypothetical protein
MIVAIDGKGKATIYKQHSLVKKKLFGGAKIAVLMQGQRLRELNFVWLILRSGH